MFVDHLLKIRDIFHNCPEQEQQQQSNPKALGSKFPGSKKEALSLLRKTRLLDLWMP